MRHSMGIYTVHDTETNKRIITRAIEEWTKKRISCVSDQEIMANFWVGPKLREYHTNPLLQKVYPHILYSLPPDMHM